MGKQGSPKSPRPGSLSFDAYSGLKEYQLRWNEMLQNGDPSLGRRVSGGEYNWDKPIFVKGFKNDSVKYNASKGGSAGKKHLWWLLRHLRSIIFTFMLLGFFFLLDSLMFSLFDPTFLEYSPYPSKAYDEKGRNAAYDDQEKSPVLYSRLLHMASLSLAEKDPEETVSKSWKEQFPQASTWKPCADKNVKRAGTVNNHTGFILVSANGGLNQQRVAVCNAVAVASLLNATLVIPKFLYSNVWKDPSQFSDIYQEETFMYTLKDDINIIKELPSHLRSLDLEAIGSLVTDADLAKEATPNEYIKNILPILLRNGIVHFLGFGNRLGFDPLPSDLQKLRCKCNFHALKFVPKIQKIGSLLVKRIRKYDSARSMLDKQLLGNFIAGVLSGEQVAIASPSKYLALHLRFEVDMVAYSMCDFGGGENETRELQAYREEHFPLLLERLKKMKPLSPAELRNMGRCPLTPEEAALVLAGLGFSRGTYIYLAGSQIYGGKSRMRPISSLYPNICNLGFHKVLLSHPLAALDFIACAASDVFAMTDSGSQLSSLVSGFRTYYGGGNAPTLRPSKKRLAAILQENSTIRWQSFENRIRKMIEEGQRVHIRGFGRSIYRQPRCKECMCKHH
ncbi:UNVERIFIED_CONTAM: O-fucosyltransferase 8 [Sesamum radiatum]|uniref:O-fucosyltransferase family protein n=1 Tax=Sesamum radiatum TaxID=300843 RepID=A0AAW2T1X9_SESRA